MYTFVTRTIHIEEVLELDVRLSFKLFEYLTFTVIIIIQ